jgi:hypothetical protein
MGMSDQRHTPAALYPRGNDTPVPIEQEAEWAPEPVWTQELEEKSSALVEDRTPIVQPVVRHYTTWPTNYYQYYRDINVPSLCHLLQDIFALCPWGILCCGNQMILCSRANGMLRYQLEIKTISFWLHSLCQTVSKIRSKKKQNVRLVLWTKIN